MTNIKKAFFIALCLSYLPTSFCKTESLKDDTKLPIFFHPSYDIGFFGIEKLHPFDTKKYGKIKAYIQEALHLKDEQLYTPNRISDDELKKMMTQKYLNSLYYSYNVAWIAELPILAFIPNFLVRRNLLDPMRYATDGTIQATLLAIDPDNKDHYAVNLSGGYHHAQGTRGEGFCVYPDIQLACKRAWETNPTLKILYVDLDAHQGNGVELTLEREIDEGLFVVFDMYGDGWPHDANSIRIRKKIEYNYPLPLGQHIMQDDDYLGILENNLPRAIAETEPGLIFYNAGTDIYEKDQIGGMNVTAEGIKKRDAFVFRQAKESKIPIVMTLSGGYSKESWQIIGQSIVNIITTIMQTRNTSS